MNLPITGLQGKAKPLSGSRVDVGTSLESWCLPPSSMAHVVVLCPMDLGWGVVV